MWRPVFVWFGHYNDTHLSIKSISVNFCYQLLFLTIGRSQKIPNVFTWRALAKYIPTVWDYYETLRRSIILLNTYIQLYLYWAYWIDVYGKGTNEAICVGIRGNGGGMVTNKHETCALPSLKCAPPKTQSHFL